ncbi:hypothetical protein GOP47_0027234 [Adiantum capillus-veneris]|nr:hypothetical protein GOP47_0027234 [Adiantum capillus-veneris]
MVLPHFLRKRHARMVVFVGPSYFGGSLGGVDLVCIEDLKAVSVLCVVKVWGFWLVDATCEAKQKYGSGAALKHGVERWKLSVAWCLQWASAKGIWLPLLSLVESRFHSLTLIIAWITQGSLMSFRAVEMNITT